MKYTVPIDMGGFKISNLPDGVNPQDAATVNQLNAAVQGYSWKQPVRAASTANVTLSGLQTLDGVSLVAGNRFLAKDQTNAADRGPYIVSSGAWTRATDMDTGAEALGAAFFVSEGTANGNTVWLQTADAPITIGTTALAFAQIGGGSTYTAGNGVTINTGVIAVDPTVVARKASATIGDGTTTTITFTHNLNTQDVTVAVKEVSTNSGVITDWVANGVNTVQLTFGTAPTTGQYRVTVVA